MLGVKPMSSLTIGPRKTTQASLMTRNVYSPPEANLDGAPAPTVAAQDTHPRQFISFDHLTRGNKWRFVWGFFWRSLCAAVASFVGGFIAGALLGFIIAIVGRVAGVSMESVRSMSQVLGGICGVGVSLLTLWQLIRWYFRANWFGHRLVLVRDDA
jgi:hypothetical protein